MSCRVAQKAQTFKKVKNVLFFYIIFCLNNGDVFPWYNPLITEKYSLLWGKQWELSFCVVKYSGTIQVLC